MYVNYRDIESDDTVDALLANFAVYFYARQVYNQLDVDDVQRLIIKQTMVETSTKLQLNSYYTQIADNDILKERIYNIDMDIRQLDKEFCSDQLCQLLSNEKTLI